MVENDTNRSLIVNKHFRYKYAQGTPRKHFQQGFSVRIGGRSIRLSII